MELDELKRGWAEQKNSTTTSEIHTTELIRQKSRSPIVALKKRFRKQIVLICFSFSLIVYTSRNKDFINDLFFWCYVAFCATICLFFYLNYRIAAEMENRDENVVNHLRKQIDALEKRMVWHRRGVRIAFVVFFILAELVPLVSYEPMLEKWRIVPWYLRVLCYLALLAFQYFAGRALSRKRFGRPLSELKLLLAETQEQL